MYKFYPYQSEITYAEHLLEGSAHVCLILSDAC